MIIGQVLFWTGVLLAAAFLTIAIPAFGGLAVLFCLSSAQSD